MLKTRTYTLSEKNKYAIPSLGLIFGWKVSCPVDLYISMSEESFCKKEILVNVPRKDEYHISVKEIRDYIRNIDSMEDSYDCEDFQSLPNLERDFFFAQLVGTETYKKASQKEMNESVFTKEMVIKLVPRDSNCNGVDVEETYWERFPESQ